MVNWIQKKNSVIIHIMHFCSFFYCSFLMGYSAPLLKFLEFYCWSTSSLLALSKLVRKKITKIGPVKFSVRTTFGDDKFRWEKFSVALLHRNYFTPKFIVSNVHVTVNVDNWSFYRITGHCI